MPTLDVIQADMIETIIQWGAAFLGVVLVSTAFVYVKRVINL